MQKSFKLLVIVCLLGLVVLVNAQVKMGPKLGLNL